MASDDHELLRDFAAHGSQPAFRRLVDRHVALVHSTARRRLNDPGLAEDVTQEVFTLLAAKAARLGPPVVLSGWLYRTALNVAAATLRKETRRQRREQAAAQAMEAHVPDTTWRDIEPMLDAAMATLNEADRDAVVLRYFENRGLRDVGLALGVSEDAAQKRLSRAVEKLRAYFARRGQAVTGAALTAAIAAGAVQTAPAGLGAAVATAVLAHAPLLGASAAPFALMSMKPILVTLGAVGAASVILYQNTQLRSAQAANGALTERLQQAERSAGEAAQQVQALREAAEKDPRIAELARLRGEVAGLRRDAARLQSENQALKQTTRASPPPAAPANAELDQVKDRGIARLNYAKQWVLALVLHAQDHDGRFPDDLAQATPYFGPGSGGLSAPQADFFQSLAADQFELMYRGKFESLTQPASTIVLREREAWPVPGKPGLARTYGFADGHSEIHHADDGKFDDWEKTRLASP